MTIRRALAWTLMAALVGLAGWAGVGLFDREVRHVVVEGSLSDMEQKAVSEQVRGALPASMLALDLSAVTDLVMALDWVETASVRRDWPETITLRITKPAVVARWAEGGFISARGNVIAMAEGMDGNALPELGVVHATAARAIELFDVLSNRLAMANLRIRSLRENAVGEWELVLTSGLAIRLGRQDLLERLDRSIRVYRFELSSWASLVDVMDARYHNGVAVGWRAGSPLVALQTDDGR